MAKILPFPPTPPPSGEPEPPVDPAEQALEDEILAGYSHRGIHRGFRPSSTAQDLAAVRRLRAFMGVPLTRWTYAERLKYAAKLAHLKRTTLRRVLGTLRRFLEFARDPAYDWNARCRALTGHEIPQIFSWDDVPPHGHGAETSERKRLTAAQLTRLYATIGSWVGEAGRTCEWLARCTLYAILNALLIFGGRVAEIAGADTDDLAPASTPILRAFGAFEDLEIRHGKAPKGKAEKRRSVCALPLFRQSLVVLEWYLREIRPQVVRPESPDALFLNMRGQRFTPQRISTIVSRAMRRARLKGATAHTLRHTYATLLREAGLDLGSLSQQLGHASETTTAIYDHTAPERVKLNLLDFARAVIALSEAAGADV